jgi:hypothetical protein
MSFEDTGNYSNRRATDPVIELIAHKMERVEESVGKMAEAVTKLAVIEERQVSDRAALERAFIAIQKTDERCSAMFEKCVAKLEKTDSRVDALEVEAPESKQTSEWVKGAIYGAAGLAAMFVAKQAGL